jgi:Protein of unknown function (DUF3579)
MEHLSNPQARSWIIFGKTTDDKTFRPSNWADRLCELGATFDDRGLFSYSKHLHPVHCKEVPAVRVNRTLMSEQPGIWKQVVFFVGLHKLQHAQYISPFDAFMKTVLGQTKQHLFGDVANDSVVALEA